MPSTKLTPFKTMVKEKIGADVILTKCRRSKLRVFKKLLGLYNEEYGILCDHVEKLKLRNPRTSCHLRVDPPLNGDERPLFNNFYFCFDALKKMFYCLLQKSYWYKGCPF